MTGKPTWDVVAVSGTNLDYLVRGHALPKPGETVIDEQFQEAPGGKGANQAVAAARLDARVALVRRVGTDARGKAILRKLKEAVLVSIGSSTSSQPISERWVINRGAAECPAQDASA